MTIRDKNRLEAYNNGEKRYYGKPCKHGHDGLRYVYNTNCVECVKLAAKKSNKKHAYHKRPEVIERQKAFQKKNNQTEKRKKYMREYMREYSKKHPEKMSEIQRNWYKNNPEKVKERTKERYYRDHEATKKYQREYRRKKRQELLAKEFENDFSDKSNTK